MQKIAVHKDARLRELFLLLIAVALVGLLTATGWFSLIQDRIFVVAAPLLRIHTQVVSAVSFPVKSIFSGVDKQKKILLLTAEVSQLHARIAELEQVERENQALREIVGNSNRTLEKVVVAAPIVSLAYPAISAGSDQHISEGSMVVIAGTLVGTVTEVTTHQSKVLLLGQQSEHPILAKTEHGVEGILVGDGRTISLQHIPREVELTEGEQVFTMGQQGIRKNMYIGKIVRIEAPESAPTKKAFIEQYVSFYDSALVEVW